MEMVANISVNCKEAQKAKITAHEVFSSGVIRPKLKVAASEAINSMALVVRSERFFFLYGRNVRLRSCIC